MRILTKRAVVAVAIGMLAGCATPQGAVVEPATRPAMPVYSDILSAYGGGGGGAVGIVSKDGAVLHLSAIDAANGDGAALDTDTVMPIGSITKQVTATLVMLLVEDDRLDLDVPVATYLPDYAGPARNTTLRQLLAHKAGMVNFPADFFNDPATLRREWTTADLLALSVDEPLLHAPGTTSAYSNPGYFLVGAVIERVTGQEWHRLVEQRIAAPLGLETLRYDPRLLSARGLDGFGGDGAPIETQRLAWAHAAGGLSSSADDLRRFFEALHGGRLVDDTSHAALFSGTAGHEPIFPATMIRGVPVYDHAGGLRGFAAAGFYDSASRAYAAVLTNAPAEAPRRLIARRMLAEAMGRPYPQFAAAEWADGVLADAMGLYADAAGAEIVLRDLRGTTVLQADGRGAIPLATGADEILYARGHDLGWARLDRSGEVPTLMVALDGEGPLRRFVRVGPVPDTDSVAVPDALLDTYVGRYAGPGELVIAILRREGGLRIDIAGQGGADLVAVAPDTFMVDGDTQRFRLLADDGTPARALIIESRTDTFEAPRLE